MVVVKKKRSRLEMYRSLTTVFALLFTVMPLGKV